MICEELLPLLTSSVQCLDTQHGAVSIHASAREATPTLL